MTRTFSAFTLLFALAIASNASAADPLIVPLWPESSLTKIPESETAVERSKDPAKPDNIDSE